MKILGVSQIPRVCREENRESRYEFGMFNGAVGANVATAGLRKES
jgi:hypothetical protein